MVTDRPDFAFEVLETRELAPPQREALLALFAANYREANVAFFDRSLARLRHVALARHEGRLVGFALSETRVLDLPRLPGQKTLLAGLSCIAPEFRRLGLFRALEGRAAGAAALPEARRMLLCGRVAHPVARRTIGSLPGAVPVASRAPTPWQQEVGAAIAATYGVHGFDPATFVCLGDGTPIGYPQLALEVESAEWDVFAPVNRARGDVLLALAWLPDAPPGW